MLSQQGTLQQLKPQVYESSMHFLWICLSVLPISKWIYAESQSFPCCPPNSCSANVKLNCAFQQNEKVQMDLPLLQKGLDRKSTAAAAAFLFKTQWGEVAEALQTDGWRSISVLTALLSSLPQIFPDLPRKSTEIHRCLITSEELSVLPCAPFSRVIKYFCSRALHMDIKFSSQT